VQDSIFRNVQEPPRGKPLVGYGKNIGATFTQPAH